MLPTSSLKSSNLGRGWQVENELTKHASTVREASRQAFSTAFSSEPAEESECTDFSPAFQVPPRILSRVEETPNKFFNSPSKRDPNHLLHLPGSFSLLRRFGVQFYTERSYHLENGVKVGTAFA
jgi:hypothetical protein